MSRETLTSYRLADGTVVRIGDRIRVVTEGTVTEITPDHIDYKAGNSDATAVYPNDGEFVSLTVLKPEVKPGQVWRAEGRTYLATEGGFAELRLVSQNNCYTKGNVFHTLYPDAQLVYDPEASHA